MKDRKLWKLLATLHTDEITHFKKWLVVELGDRQQYIQQLAEVLIGYIPQAPSDLAVWEHLYPNHPYNDPRLRKLSRDLLTQLEEFVAIQAFRQHANDKNLVLLEELHRRSNQELFIKLYRKIEHELTTQPIRNATYYQHLYKLTYLLSEHYITYHHGTKRIPAEALNHAFDAWWIHEKLELACTNMTNVSVFGEHVQTLLLDQAMQIIQEHPDAKEMQLLQLHYQLYLLLSGRKKKEEVEIDVRQQLFDLQEQLSYPHKKAIFGLLRNHYIGQLNASGQSEIAREIFELYQWAVRERLIYEADSLAWQPYKNLVTICLQVHEYEQAWEYLSELKADIPIDDREEAYIFNLGSYYLAKGQYKEVIRTLSHQKFGHPFYEIPARANLLQAHYELPGVDEEWLIGQLENLIRYVRGKKLAQTYKTAYLNRFKLFKRLVKAYTTKELERLQKDITDTHPINKADWLLEKISARLKKEK